MRTRRSGTESGFTLLELLTVMGIMLLLMGMSLAAYYGLTRSAAIDAAVSNIQSSIALARQYAITHRNRTHVLFWQDSTNAHFCICIEEGQHVGSDGSRMLIINPPRWDNGALGGNNVYNFTSGKYGIVATNSTCELVGSNPVTRAVMTWNRGDRYGWALGSQTHLPEGISYQTFQNVTFNADGTTPVGDCVIVIQEPSDLAAPVKKRITVRGLTGKIVVEDV